MFALATTASGGIVSDTFGPARDLQSSSPIWGGDARRKFYWPNIMLRACT